MPAEPFAGYADLLSNCVRASQRRAKRVKEDADPLETLADRVADQYASGSAALSGSTWSNRAVWEVELAKQCRLSYSALDQMIGLAYAMLRLLTDGFADAETSPPDVVRYAVSLLLTRAISTAHEICALLRAGFPHGAVARWRTLHEVRVVSGVLEIGNRGTAARYVNHRWVLAAKHEARELGTAIDPGALSKADIERKAKEFIRRYGQAYSGTYGWAAEVTQRKLNVAKPRFDDLEKLVLREDNKPRRGYANRAVHADSVGNLLMVSDGELHSGASGKGIEGVALATVGSLVHVIDALLNAWDCYASSSPTIALVRALNANVGVTLVIQAAGNVS